MCFKHVQLTGRTYRVNQQAATFIHWQFTLCHTCTDSNSSATFHWCHVETVFICTRIHFTHHPSVNYINNITTRPAVSVMGLSFREDLDVHSVTQHQSDWHIKRQRNIDVHNVNSLADITDSRWRLRQRDKSFTIVQSSRQLSRRCFSYCLLTPLTTHCIIILH